MDPKIEARPPFSGADISEIERVLGRQLPASYCGFVLAKGGAFVGGSVDGSDALPILDFMNARGALDSLALHSDLANDSVFPFARCELGNLYALDRDNAVYYLNYYGGRTTAVKVSDDFGDFLSRIVIE